MGKKTATAVGRHHQIQFAEVLERLTVNVAF